MFPVRSTAIWRSISACAVRPVALDEVERARGVVGQADGVRVARWSGEPDHLGFVFGRLGEPAQVGEADEQPEAIVDRGRLAASKELVDPVGRQRREVVRGQLDHSRVFAAVVVRLREIGRGENAESQVPEAPGDLQRAPAAHERLVRLVEPRVDVRHEGADAPAPARRRSTARPAPRPRAAARAPAGTRRAGSAPAAARGESRRPAPVWTDSPAAARGHRGPGQSTPERPEAPTARPPSSPACRR